MNNKVFIVFHRNYPLVVIEKLPELYEVSKVLNWYAAKYGFYRKDLTYGLIEKVQYNLPR